MNSIARPSNKDKCIGAVVGKNPGSAKPCDKNSSSIQEIKLDRDQLLRNIKSILIKSHQRINKPIPESSYVQMLNLFYICDKDLNQAIKKIEVHHSSQSICGTEAKDFPFLWYVWGGDNKKLNFYKSRIFNIKADRHFYLDTKTNKVVDGAPQLSDCARHTQGMKHDFIVPYISSVLYK
ncbi:hypothetical protein [Thalassobacillus devorans]|uniref:hypothetical protein n=1 Tax=Thalassobacillus devorans TaxID=279813 RepID=UPI001592E02B|nr:hypothetical protein [Thalassobacillus devorans]